MQQSHARHTTVPNRFAPLDPLLSSCAVLGSQDSAFRSSDLQHTVQSPAERYDIHSNSRRGEGEGNALGPLVNIESICRARSPLSVCLALPESNANTARTRSGKANTIQHYDNPHARGARHGLANTNFQCRFQEATNDGRDVSHSHRCGFHTIELMPPVIVTRLGISHKRLSVTLLC